MLKVNRKLPAGVSDQSRMRRVFIQGAPKTQYQILSSSEDVHLDGLPVAAHQTSICRSEEYATQEGLGGGGLQSKQGEKGIYVCLSKVHVVESWSPPWQF